MVSPLINPAGSRNEEQKAMMERMLAAGICPFCPGNFPNDIIWENEFWSLSHNLWPRENAEFDLLMVCKVSDPHIVTLAELVAKPEVCIQMWECAAWAEDHLKIGGGVMILRFGDFDLSGASIAHLHYHVFVPKSPGFKFSIKIRPI
jgi:hypothetical protein